MGRGIIRKVESCSVGQTAAECRFPTEEIMSALLRVLILTLNSPKIVDFSSDAVFWKKIFRQGKV